MMFVRLAIESDKEQIRDLALAHVAEITPDQIWSEQRAEAMWDKHMHGGNPVLFVAEERREVVGYVSGFMTDNPYTEGITVALDVFYVRPDKRGSRAAAQLITAFNRWADRLQPTEILVRASNARISPKMSAFLRRHGFKEVGTNYVKE